MALSLVVGPAHAGKVALLLERFLELRDRDPWLVVPNRPDVERMERELLERSGALLQGRVSTFEMLFAEIAGGVESPKRVIGDAEQLVVVRRLVRAGVAGNDNGSAGFPGFAEALAAALTDVGTGLVPPTALSGQLAEYAVAYRRELDRLGVWDRALQREHAVERLGSELGAWDARPVLAHGFEDLTGVEWRLLETLAARTDVHVSLPYEPGRVVYASLSRLADDLAGLAGGRVVELPSRAAEFRPPALAHLERHLFEDEAERVPTGGSIRLLEGAGRRATLELVADEIHELVASGVAPEAIGVVCPSVEAASDALHTAFTSLGVPYALEAPVALSRLPLGRALRSLLRVAWMSAGRSELFSYLRSPYSGLQRSEVDFVEGRLRGRAVTARPRVLEVLAELRGGRPVPLLAELEGADDPVSAVRDAVEALVRAAHGPASTPVGEDAASDLRALAAVRRTLDGLARLAEPGPGVTRDEVLAALDRATVGSRASRPGCVAVLDLERARTRRFDSVFVLGLESGSLPRRERSSPFLDEDERRELDRAHGGRLERPDRASRDRYLFATACSRAERRLVLVREAASDEGSPREPSPFWDAVTALFDPDDIRLGTVRRPLSRPTWPIEQAPTERERLRALAVLHRAAPGEAEALALANGWQRKLQRARAAFSRPTALSNEASLAVLGNRETVRVTDLERMAGCSAAWFVERLLDPRRIDQEPDARLKGILAHKALQRFYERLPSEIPGAERVTPENVEHAVSLMDECLRAALETGLRLEISELERSELAERLRLDLEQVVRDEARSESPFVPRRLEVSFSGYRVADDLSVSGKIDRVDVDPHSARGIVVDYKSGNAPSARQIRDDLRVQVPLYMLVLRDELGLEPVGGVYRPIGGGRRTRGMLVGGEERVPGFVAADYLDPETFWEDVDHAREVAVGLARRMRAGDIRHDPHGGECPSWCDLWPICRKPRP